MFAKFDFCLFFAKKSNFLKHFSSVGFLDLMSRYVKYWPVPVCSLGLRGQQCFCLSKYQLVEFEIQIFA